MGMFTCVRDTESSQNDIAENNLYEGLHLSS
jgi:hypothetical protein